MHRQPHDPYAACPASCAHDLAGGVLIADLLRTDGPHPALMVVEPGRRPGMPAAVTLRRAS